jgi:hypothetical protein
MKKIALVLSVIFLMAGCANKGIPVDKAATATKSITIVPTGKIRYDVSSNRGGAGFGLIGALIEQAATADGNKNSGTILEKEVSQDLIFNAAIDEFKKNLAKSGPNQLVTVSAPVLSDKPSQEWFADTKKEHLTKNPNLKSDLALEISFPSVGISKEFGGYYAIGFISAKLVDIKTGAIVGSASAYNIGMTSGIAIDGDEGKPDYAIAVKKAFDTLSRSLANQAYAKLYPTQ